MDAVMQAFATARKESGLTQKELATRTGVDQADISKLERGGGNPTLALLQRLAQGMNMRVAVEFVPDASVHESYLERNLPPYLQEDIGNFVDGLRRNLTTRLDGLYNEVQSSINVAYHGGAIDGAQAEYLRDKYLRGKDGINAH